MNTVYALIDPRDKGIKYVGVTANMPSRMSQHRQGKMGSIGLRNWVAELKGQGLKVEFKVLEDGISNEDAGRTEGKWIRQIRSDGASLLNLRPGGDGRCGSAWWGDSSDTVLTCLRKVPTAMHRALTIAAMDAGESLEQFITNRLQTLIKGA